MSNWLTCPRCGKGRLVLLALNEPATYSCGHQDLTTDLKVTDLTVGDEDGPVGSDG